MMRMMVVTASAWIAVLLPGANVTWADDAGQDFDQPLRDPIVADEQVPPVAPASPQAAAAPEFRSATDTASRRVANREARPPSTAPALEVKPVAPARHVMDDSVLRPPAPPPDVPDEATPLRVASDTPAPDPPRPTPAPRRLMTIDDIPSPVAELDDESPGTRNNVLTLQPAITVEIQNPAAIGVGQAAAYVVSVTNRSSAVVETVQVEVTIPATVELVSANPEATLREEGVLRFALGDIGGQDARRIRLELKPRQLGVLNLRAVASLSASAQTEVQVQEPLPRADLALSVKGPQANGRGQEGVYEIRVENPGDAPARDVQVVDNLAEGLQITVVNRPVEFAAGKNALVWRLDHLAPGAAEVLLFKVRAAESGEFAQAVIAQARGGLRAEAETRTTITGHSD
jgi:uncharacterized repeat protein (TIGR01451 family)